MSDKRASGFEAYFEPWGVKESMFFSSVCWMAIVRNRQCLASSNSFTKKVFVQLPPVGHNRHSTNEPEKHTFFYILRMDFRVTPLLLFEKANWLRAHSLQIDLLPALNTMHENTLQENSISSFTFTFIWSKYEKYETEYIHFRFCLFYSNWDALWKSSTSCYLPKKLSCVYWTQFYLFCELKMIEVLTKLTLNELNRTNWFLNKMYQ